MTINRSKGNPKAAVHIIEYIDFQCPSCVKGALMLKGYLQKYPSQIYLEVRYYPITKIHQYALKSALYAECAARQNKFWPFQDLLAQGQSQWSRLLNVDSTFRAMAKEANLDMAKLESCISDEKVKEVIFKEKTEAKAFGVDSTPTYFVNGKMVVGIIELQKELNTFLGGNNH